MVGLRVAGARWESSMRRYPPVKGCERVGWPEDTHGEWCRGPAPKPSAREIDLGRRSRKLERDPAQAKAVIEFQERHELLGISL
jgi:hypothetical protein